MGRGVAFGCAAVFVLLFVSNQLSFVVDSSDANLYAAGIVGVLGKKIDGLVRVVNAEIV